MNNWMKRVVSIAFVIAQFLVIPEVSASSLESIENEKHTLETEVNQNQQKINDNLAKVNELSTSLEKLNKEITQHEESIVETEKDIEAQEELVEKRYEHTAEQLKAIQKSEVNQNVILNIFQADSMTEFFNAVYTASILTGASENQLIEVQEEQDKLDNLKEDLLVYQEELDEKKTQTVEQKEELDNNLSDLKTTLASNQQELDELNTQEENLKKEQQAQEEKRKQEEEVVKTASSKKEKSETKEENSNKSDSNESSSNESSSNDSNSNKSNSNESSPKEETETSSKSTGSWMNYQATGYSLEEPGLTNTTATGIDLRKNPKVIAVDPSQIPLGSLVEVEGMGTYVAGDTGSAINGQIIDIHFSSVSEALSWGRRNVRIRIVD